MASTRSLPSRSTRGKRTNQLVGDDVLVDEEFWKMDMFNEDMEDEEYKSEAEEEDIIDADFDNPEEQESDKEIEVDKEKKEKKRSAYVDPKSKKAPKKRKIKDPKAKTVVKENNSDEEADTIERENSQEEEKSVKKRKKIARDQDREQASGSDVDHSPSHHLSHDGEDDSDNQDNRRRNTPGPPTSTRKSTRSVAIQRAAEREKTRAEHEKKKTLRGPKKRSAAVVRRITQEELLEEAKVTEIFNTESLKHILSMEEEKKKIKEAPIIVGPAVKYYSKEGKTWVQFTEVPTVLIDTTPPVPCPRSICPITGLPAKYKDPKTGICYANLEAFKTLRTNLLQKEETECNEKIAQLSVLLQESRVKKELLLSKGVVV